MIAGGLALGFAASRFLKASSTRRYEGALDTSRGFTSGGPTRSAALPAGDVTNGHTYADREAGVGTGMPPVPPLPETRGL